MHINKLIIFKIQVISQMVVHNMKNYVINNLIKEVLQIITLIQLRTQILIVKLNNSNNNIRW